MDVTGIEGVYITEGTVLMKSAVCAQLVLRTFLNANLICISMEQISKIAVNKVNIEIINKLV